MSGACWVLLLLLGVVGSACANHSESTCVCDDHLETVCVRAGANVTVPCLEWSKLTKKWEDMRFNLYHDRGVVLYHECSFFNNTQKCELHLSGGEELHTSGGVELLLNNESISFVLAEVNANSHGLYRCESVPTYPPPLLPVRRAAMVLLLLEGHQCKVDTSCNSPEADVKQWKIWIGALVPLFLYSVFISIVACVNWVKLKKAECQTDYMNTKPKATRRKRGIQNPIPRHF